MVVMQGILKWRDKHCRCMEMCIDMEAVKLLLILPLSNKSGTCELACNSLVLAPMAFATVS